MKKSHYSWLFMLALFVLMSTLLSACMHKHAYDKERVDKNATCTEDGSIVRTCECGAEDVEVIPAKGHKDGEWTVDSEPTCAEKGSRHLVCKICNETIKTEKIPAKDHTTGEWTVDSEATCTEKGSKHLVCDVCNETVKTEKIPAKGHTEGEWKVVSEATCTEKGSRQLQCKVCGDAIKTEEISVKGHTEGEWITVTKATCTKAGSKHLACKDCNITMRTEVIPAKGSHNYSEKVLSEASCTNSGKKQFTCADCGDSYTETYELKPYSATEIYESYMNSVGEIIIYDQSGRELALGTCFVYSSDGKLVTNYHVIDQAYSAKVFFADATYEVQKVLAYDKDIDLAILKISATNLKPVKICEKTHKVGEVVYAFGSSKGMTATFSDGMITYANRKVEGVTYTQHDAPISSGNSGGPLINQYGEVIGINTLTVKESQNLNFAINISELKKLNTGSSKPMGNPDQGGSGQNGGNDQDSGNGQDGGNGENGGNGGNDQSGATDVYATMKNYIMQKGQQRKVDDIDLYCLKLGTNYSEGAKLERWAVYRPGDDMISLALIINGNEAVVYFDIDNNVDGTYAWEYSDKDGNLMYGTLYATAFRSETLIGHDDDNIDNEQDRNDVRELASAMAYVICSNITKDFAETGVTAAHLQFYAFS